jgi:hypothetical protein
MNERHESAEKEIVIHRKDVAGLESAKVVLDGTLRSAKKTSSRCTSLIRRLGTTKSSLVQKQNDFQRLKEAASAFYQWTDTVQSRSKMTTDFVDGDELVELTKNLVQDLENCNDKSIKEVCEPLRRLALK